MYGEIKDRRYSCKIVVQLIKRSQHWFRFSTSTPIVVGMWNSQKVSTSAIGFFDCHLRFADQVCNEFRATYFCGRWHESYTFWFTYLDTISCCHTFFLFYKIIHFIITHHVTNEVRAALAQPLIICHPLLSMRPLSAIWMLLYKYECLVCSFTIMRLNVFYLATIISCPCNNQLAGYKLILD